VLVINSNVEEYSVTLFSKSTAQKSYFECPERSCELRDISPFHYNISLIKNGYETQNLQIEIGPRSNQELVIYFEKKVEIRALEPENIDESLQEKIARLRESGNYYSILDVQQGKRLLFQENWDLLTWVYQLGERNISLGEFPKTIADEIRVETIAGSDDIFFALGSQQYVFFVSNLELKKIEFWSDVKYIKPTPHAGKYILVTQQGSFLYDIRTSRAEFQYVFKDFVYYEDFLIGMIFADEDQKRRNFNIEQSGNLIMRYSSQTKERKILYSTRDTIEKIETVWGDIILMIDGKKYSLENFD
jgi:hypothetical protein